MNPLIISPSIKAEQTIGAFLSSSLNSGSFVANVYTGINNEDKEAPSVVVVCKDANEVVFNSRCYAFDIEILVKEIAADDTVDNYSSIAGNVLSYFADSVAGCANINSIANGIRFWQIQITGINNAVYQDAWVNQFSIRLIGALVPTS